MRTPIFKPILKSLSVLLLALPIALAAQSNAGEESSDNPFEQELPTVIIHTSKGPITVELFSDQAPKSTENFLEYARSGHYAGTLFHRVIGNFMIQGGGFDRDMQQKPTREPVQNEADNGLSNARGTLAMARTNMPHSATS
ncbi:MAG: peptidylprolyl isomerase, partial [Wenzhouxiangellaceae bacterium]